MIRAFLRLVCVIDRRSLLFQGFSRVKIRCPLRRWRWPMVLVLGLLCGMVWILPLAAQESVLPAPPQAPASLDTEVLMPQLQTLPQVVPQGEIPISAPTIPQLQDSITAPVETLESTVGREIVIERAPDPRVQVDEPGVFREREVPVVFQERSSNTTIRVSPGHGIQIERPQPPTPAPDTSLQFDPQIIPDLSSLRYPLPTAVPITSGFGMRTHPVSGEEEFHLGVDLGGSLGTPILAALPGQIVAAAPSGGLGNAVTLAHGSRLRTRYGHMSEIAVTAGQVVQQGDVIGYVGSTGLSTGPHLHFEIWQANAAGSWTALDGSELLRVAVAQLPK